MTTGATDTAALACVPEAIPEVERPAHFALVQHLFRDLVLERHPLPDGYEFHFHADALEPLSRFVVRERRCCAFLTFTLRISPAKGPIRLRLTGPEGTREFIEAALPL